VIGFLSLITWLPLAGAIVLMLLPSSNRKLIQGLALATAGATLALSLLLVSRFDSSAYKFQFLENLRSDHWGGIGYRLGVDGLSLWLVVLASLITMFAIAFGHYTAHRLKLFMALILVLQTAMIGCFLSLDLILFYTFFELSLVPMYFLIAIWGGERRGRAAAKFFIYTFAGSIFMLVGMVTMAYLHSRATGQWSFSILEIQASVANGSLWAGALQAQTLIFWSFAIAFLIKAPAFPFHTWIPDAYSESPIAGPMLSSVMVKMGSYGLLRFCLPLFPDVIQRQIPVLMGLAVVGILYGAVLACVQSDMRRMLAYSTVSHMGFVLLGIFSLNQIGMVGGAYQQISHGITASALFLLVGLLIQRRGSAMFSEYGGLKERMPLFATLFLISMLASVGLPGLNGFVGEFLAMLGAFQSGFQHLYGLREAFVVIAGLGVVLSAAYLLYMYQQLFYGLIKNPINARLRDLKIWEAGLVGILVILMVWGGLYPSTFTKPMEASLKATQQMAISAKGQGPTWKDSPEQLAVRLR
jgi:NADH-quinone oxidoreductase subunit M